MSSKSVWSDVWFLVLYALSLICSFVFVLMTVGAAVFFGILAGTALGKQWFGFMIAGWVLLVGFGPGLGYVKFYWNDLLNDEAKHTSAGKP